MRYTRSVGRTSPEAFRQHALVWTGAGWDDANEPPRRIAGYDYDAVVRRLTDLLEDFAGLTAATVDTSGSTTWHELPADIWRSFDLGTASELVTWMKGGPSRRSRRPSGRHAQFQRWFGRLCAQHRNARHRILAALLAALRLGRRAVHRQRLRLHRRAIRAISSESTVVIRRHGPPAERLPLPAVSRC